MEKIDSMNLDIYFEKGELIPTICFDVDTKTVLMLAYMNKESLRKTLETGYTWFGAAHVRSIGTKAQQAVISKRLCQFMLIVITTLYL